MPRTIGAKDKTPRKSPVRKPKKIFLTKTEVDLAAKMGVTPQQLAIEKIKLSKPRKKRNTDAKIKHDARHVYRWIRSDWFKNADKSRVANREGWEPVTPEQQPGFKSNVNSYGYIEIGGLTLCRRPNINWEGLAKNLQTALRDEINENQKRSHDIDALLFKVKSLEHQIIGFQAVISYLETKSGNDTV
jgi:hypothetical protein